MDLTWLEDFVALVDAGGFSRAAERRNVTQPAFSRRIRALEDWVGAPLVDRSSHRLALTAAGERFLPVANEALRRLYLGREEAREADRASGETLRFASTHALSLTFFSGWLRGLERRFALPPIHLVADHMQACEAMLGRGAAQFLLCHASAAAPPALDSEHFVSTTLADDRLIPVSVPDAEGAPRFALPGSAARPLPALAYAATSGMGRILAAARASAALQAWLDPVFTSHLAILLKTMAVEGRGMTWAAESLVADDLALGRLVRAGGAEWDVPMQVCLVRPRARQSPIAERFWSVVAAN